MLYLESKTYNTGSKLGSVLYLLKYKDTKDTFFDLKMKVSTFKIKTFVLTNCIYFYRIQFPIQLYCICMKMYFNHLFVNKIERKEIFAVYTIY